MKKSEAQQHVDKWNNLFKPYIDKPMWVRFGNHEAQVIIKEISLAAITKMKAAKIPTPDMRQREDGKQYTPAVIQMICDSCVLHFVIEDFEFYAIMGGIEITGEGITIKITKE